MAPSTVRGGPFSPPMSSAASFSSNSQSKLNIVSRLAIEGKAKQGAEGASVKLYLKLTVPVDSVTPGQTIPLFSEENVKIRTDQVHPLDSDSAPYIFSSSANPLLHSAARALNLPARSTKSYLSLFENAAQMSPSRSGSSNGSTVPPLEERYTGYFLISGYSVCYVLPKEFPPKTKLRQNGTDSESDALGRNTPRSPYRRRNSIGERTSLQFVAALDLWVPLSSKPPKAPYMLSIPLPRCLSNYIKLRLPSPGSVSTSFASLSSDEDSGGWDVVTEPHVTRGAKPGTRSGAYNEFADDESSEASTTGVSENCLVHGTFTSSDFIRIRWASPTSNSDFPDQGEGRRRVNIPDVKGNMTCTILEMVEDGVKMRLDYQGTCSGMWFPGVATILGMDVVLDSQGCQVAWPNDSDGLWTIDGDPAFTGSSLDAQKDGLKRQNNFEVPQLNINETQDMSGYMNGETFPAGRLPSAHSASLLRAPLPSRRVSNDYSFENSVTPSTSGLPSSVPSMSTSLTRSSVNGLGELSDSTLAPPTSLFTLHLNLSELLPSSKNKFTFNISGVVIVYRKEEAEDSQSFSVSLPFPVFQVYQAERQSISQTVRSQCDKASVELDSATASFNSHSAARTIVPYGSQIRCPYEDSVIVVRPLPQQNSVSRVEELSSSVYSRVSSLGPPTRPSSPAKTSIQLEPRQEAFYDGPSTIPWAKVDVVPLITPGVDWSYAVTLSMPASGALSSQGLEFGLSHPSNSRAAPSPSSSFAIEVVTASIDGCPVKFEKLPSEKADMLSTSMSSIASPTSTTTWLSWIKVRSGLTGRLELVYVVKDAARLSASDHKGKKKRKEDGIPILLPVFSLPVGRLDVDLRRSSDLTAESGALPDSEQFLYRRKSLYDVQPSSQEDITMPRSLFSPVKPSKSSNIQTFAWKLLIGCLIGLPALVYLAYLTRHIISLREETQQLKAMIPNNWTAIFSDTVLRPGAEPIFQVSTATTTVTVISCTPTDTQSERRWFAHTVTLSVPTETPKAKPKPKVTPAGGHADGPVANEDAGADENVNEWEDSVISTDAGLQIPAIRLPVSWPLHEQYEHAKATARRGWRRVWRVVEIIINWPLPVEPVDDL